MNFTTRFAIALLCLIININLLKAQISGVTNTCSGQTLTYTSTTIADNYNWSVTGANSFADNGNSVTVEWGLFGTGQINLTTTNANGNVTGNHNLNISINGKPNPIILSGFSTNCFDGLDGKKDSCFAACQYLPTAYSTPSLIGATYSWELLGSGNLVTLNPNEVEVSWNTLGLNYLKLTISNGAGCSNTFTKCIRVIEAPNAVIGNNTGNANAVTICKNSNLYLNDLSTGSIGRRWDFGDGTFSNKINPEHTYANAGTYNLVLTANNGCYCLDYDTLVVTVENTVGPEIICSGVVCEGDTLSYSTPSLCNSFNWSAINGTVVGSNQNNTVDIVWNSHVGFLELAGTNCNTVCYEPTVEKIAVITDSIPINGPTSVCQNDVVIYSLDPLPGSVYTWNYNPNFAELIEDNEYAIKVKIKGLNGTISVGYSNNLLGCSGNSSIDITTRPKNNFSMDSEVCNNDIAEFQLNFPVNWIIKDSAGQVVYSDTNTNIANISWNAFTSGNYFLEVEKRGSYCNNLNLPFTILPAPEKPDSIYGQNSVCSALAYNYHVNPKTGYGVEWVITGGTPATAAGNNVTVNWNASGPYQLQAVYRQIASPSCISEIKLKTVSPRFNGTPQILGIDSVCGGDTMAYELNFIADNVVWSIIPNDGASILNDRFSNKVDIQFSAALTQVITIRAIGSICGTNFTLDKTVYIKTFSESFITYSNSNPCPGEVVNFGTNAINPLWTIDGVNYSQSSPNVSFDTTKSIHIKLKASNVGPYGCIVDKLTVETIKVKELPKAIITAFDPNAGFHCDDTLQQISLRAVLQNSHAAYAYQWTKDGVPVSSLNNYSTPQILPHGEYKVRVYSNNGCSSISDPYLILTCPVTDGCPRISVDTTITVNVVMDSINCSQFFISQVNVTNATLNEVYIKNSNLKSLNIGPYGEGVKLEAGMNTIIIEGSVTNANGTFCFIKSVVVNSPAIADFEIVRLPCTSNGFEKFQFINTSTFATSTPVYSWNFGSGTNLNGGPNPIVQFVAGTYNITLAIAGVNCVFQKQLVVDEPTNANFFSTAPACQQEPVDFTNNSTGNIVQYKWNLGGKVLFNENPTVTFEEDNGQITSTIAEDVFLSILNDNGCRDTAFQQVSIKGNTLNTSLFPSKPSAFCEGNSLLMSTAPGFSPTNTPVSYQWSNGAATPSLQVKQTGNYKLSLTDNVGCRFVTQQENVQVNAAANPTIIGKQTYCAGEAVKLNVLNHPSYMLTWFLNGASTGQTDAAYVDELVSGTYVFGINAINVNSGCANVNAPFPVTVLNQMPAPSISTTTPYPLCEGQAIQFTASPNTGNFYWNTGQTGNSITQSLAGNYTVHQTAASGCKSSKSITVFPLPDFANFMKGCYCLPTDFPPDLPGIANAASYQWKKDGQLVGPPFGTFQNLPASAGAFELIATTDSGCVDSASYMNISLGGCEDCNLSLNNINLSCNQIIGDSITYNFSFNSNISNDPAFYSSDYKIRINGVAISNFQVQPNSISGITLIAGSFTSATATLNDSVCIQVTASNPGVNCTATICTVISALACDFTPAFTYFANPYTCQLQLNAANQFGVCNTVDSVSYAWLVTQGNLTFTGTDSNFTVDGLATGTAQACLQVTVFNSIDSTYCVKDTCYTILIPDCNCYNNCGNVTLLSSEFTQVVQKNDSCILEYRLVLNNPSNVFINLNYLKVTTGKVLNITPTNSANNTIAYLVRYFPEQPWNGGSVCFDLFLNNGGTDCCLSYCVNLPSCSCNLNLTNLTLSCSNNSQHPSWYNFSYTANLTGTNGFNYPTTTAATLNGNAIQLVNQTNINLVNGAQTIQGIVDLSGVPTGNPVCFNLTTNLGGVSCSNEICTGLPKVPCEIEPKFKSVFDPYTCTFTLTNLSTANPCVVIAENEIVWEVVYQGLTYTKTGNEVVFSNMRESEVEVCMYVSASDFSGKYTCTAKQCETVELGECICEEGCSEIYTDNFQFVQFIQAEDSCIIRFRFDVVNNSGAAFNTTSVFGIEGTVLKNTLISNSNGIQTFEIDFYPNQPWEGGEACFELFIELPDGQTCCQLFCYTLPKCDCNLQLSNLLIDCAGPYGTPGDFNIDFTALLNGSAGYSYTSMITATLNGNAINLTNLQPSVLTNGTTHFSALLSASQAMPGDLLCITLEAELGGKSCFATLCDTIPANNCDLSPAFTYQINANCDVEITNSSLVGSCTFIDTSSIIWYIDANPIFINDTGNVVILPKQYAQGGERVCITIQGTNWTQDTICGPLTYCEDIFYTPCPTSENPRDGEGRRERTIEVNKENSFTTYPNPAINLLIIEWQSKIKSEVTLTLFNNQSQLVLSQKLKEKLKSFQLNLNNFAAGVYVLEVEEDGKIQREKIVILNK